MNYTLKYRFILPSGGVGLPYKKSFKHRKDLVDYIRMMLSRNIGFCVVDAWYRDNYFNNAEFFHTLLNEVENG